MYMCMCKGLKESHVEEVGRLGITSPEGLIAALELDDGNCCGRCAHRIDAYVAVAKRARSALNPVTADCPQSTQLLLVQ
jgi:bacterioferritin-associated ferredoxin